MHIFVTLEEFLANGGTLTDGKGLFTSSIKAQGSNVGNIYKKIGWYDAFTEAAPEGMVTVSASNKMTYALPNFIVYVAIEVTPIYK